MKYFLLLILCCGVSIVAAQKSIIRGVVTEQESGSPVYFADVYLLGTEHGTTTDADGFYSLTGVAAGKYKIVANYIGYKADTVEIKIGMGEIKNVYIELSSSGVDLDAVNVRAQQERREKEVRISSINVQAEQIQLLPSTGGSPDIAQYLAVLPGVIFTGGQGGQLYIRGGAPVQTKILMDGMTIYNPFHSIGFFSVFETAAIQDVEVYTGGFDASYGGRISAIIDISMRSGNRKETSGLISVSPFQSKVLIEGPIIPLSKTNRTSLSYLLTAKKSMLPYTGNSVYSYALQDGKVFDYRDIYGKISVLSNLGTNFNVFGFNFTDNVNYPGLAALKWNAWGIGTNFKVIPPHSNVLVHGSVNISDYGINLDKFDDEPRFNSILNYVINLELSSITGDNRADYGLKIEGFNTRYEFINNLNVPYSQEENTIELSAYANYKFILGKLVLNPSIRFQYYAVFSEPSLEPRLRMKYNFSERLRFKIATGYYTQNLISTVNENEVVNLFNGFLSGPERALFNPVTGERLNTQLQRAIHYIAGVEYDPINNLHLNLEGYFKDYLTLININNNKRETTDPNYIPVVGDAYGLELSALYNKGPWYLWGAYSYGFVHRNDGEQRYPTVFDRRHNLNLLGTYRFGNDDSWAVSVRWNFGTGFPFTKTLGYYTFYSFINQKSPNYTTGNPDEIGIIYDNEKFGGRLPSYHRLDMSVKKKIKFSDDIGLDLTLSVTNVYNRDNIFYFDRIKYERVNQLPILPSVSAKFYF